MLPHRPRPTASLLPLLLGLLLVLAACGRDESGPLGPLEGDAPTAQVVRLAAGASVADLARVPGVEILRQDPDHGLALVRSRSPRGRLPRSLVRTVQPQSAVEISGDPEWGYQEGDPEWGYQEWDSLAADGQQMMEQLELSRAWTVRRGAGVRVAVLDTGVDGAHPRLLGRVEALPPTSSFASGESSNGMDDDGDGLIDEGYGHGTHVAGVILGVAPAATVVSFAVLGDDGFGTVYDVAQALLEARDLAVSVVNLSLSFGGDSPVVDEILVELEASGIVVLAAAGNRRDNVPAPASSPTVLAVTAVDDDDLAPSFVWNSGAALAAPGAAILGPYPDGRMVVAGGTSMACAVASGCVALLSEGSDAVSARQALTRSALPADPRLALVHGRVAPWTALQAD